MIRLLYILSEHVLYYIVSQGTHSLISGDNQGNVITHRHHHRTCHPVLIITTLITPPPPPPPPRWSDLGHDHSPIALTDAFYFSLEDIDSEPDLAPEDVILIKEENSDDEAGK